MRQGGVNQDEGWVRGGGRRRGVFGGGLRGSGKAGRNLETQAKGRACAETL